MLKKSTTLHFSLRRKKLKTLHYYILLLPVSSEQTVYCNLCLEHFCVYFSGVQKESGQYNSSCASGWDLLQVLLRQEIRPKRVRLWWRSGNSQHGHGRSSGNQTGWVRKDVSMKAPYLCPNQCVLNWCVFVSQSNIPSSDQQPQPVEVRAEAWRCGCVSPLWKRRVRGREGGCRRKCELVFLDRTCRDTVISPWDKCLPNYSTETSPGRFPWCDVLIR